jgi:putative addiction module killer protein
MIQVREYLDSRGRSPYGGWFNRLGAPAPAKVATAVVRIAAGNLSNVRSVGSGLFEYKIDVGPGYRIDTALANWQDYKRRKENHHALDS